MGAPSKKTKTRFGKPCKTCGGALYYVSTGSCVKCTRTAARKAYQAFPEKAREGRKIRYTEHNDTHRDIVLRSNYGISLEDYEALLKKQKGKCAICRNTCTSGRRLSVDHDHETKRVRGLLCLNCNRGLGNFRDDPALLHEAAAYLERAA